MCQATCCGCGSAGEESAPCGKPCPRDKEPGSLFSSVDAPGLSDSHPARCYPCILFHEDVEMLAVPILSQARRRFRISKRVKGADERHIVCSGFQEREGAKSRHMVEEGDKAFLHTLDKFLPHPWDEFV